MTITRAQHKPYNTIAWAAAAFGTVVDDFPALQVFDAEGLIEIVFLTNNQLPPMDALASNLSTYDMCSSLEKSYSAQEFVIQIIRI
jgi:hypothetical protein